VEFDHQQHWALYDRVGHLLDVEFGDLVDRDPDDPSFFVEVDGVLLIVRVASAGPKTAITIYTRPRFEVEVTADVAAFLLQVNFGHSIPFGNLGLNDEDEITLSHVLMGEGLEDDALVLMLHLIASKMEQIETELESRFV
jgi:hypothetical protein